MRHLSSIPGGRCRYWILLLLLAALPLAGDQPDDMTDTFYFPFILDGREVGEVEIGLDDFYEPKYLNTEELLDFLTDKVRADAVEFLEEEPWLSFSQLRGAGIPVEYLERELVLSLDIPAEIALPVTFSMKRDPPRRYGTEIDAADFSFYTNIYTNLSYRNMFTDNIFRVDSIVFEPNLNYQEWVMESRFSLTHSEDDPPFRLSETRHARLVKYPEDSHTRIVIGDLISRDIPFYGGGSWGFLVEHNRALGPSPRWNTNYEFTHLLDERSNVELRLNEREIFSRRLRPGDYTFRDFSLISGVNELTLIKEGEDDQQERITKEIPFDTALIPKGTSEFGFGAGFPSFTEAVTDPKDAYRLFGYVRGGLSHQLTSSYYFDLGYRDQLHGMRFNLATLYGNFSWDSNFTFDLNDGAIDDYYSSLSFRNYDREANRTFGFRALVDSHTQRDEDDQVVNLSEMSLTFNYSQALFPPLNFHTSFGFAYDWQGQEPQTIATAGLRHRYSIDRDTRLYTTVSADLINLTMQASVFLSTSFADNRITASGRQSFDIDYERDDNIRPSTSLSASYRPERTSPFGPVTLNISDFDYEKALPQNVQVSGSYSNPYLSSSFQQSFRLGEADPGSRLSLRLNTAVAYADGVFTVTRPITNSFILVKPGVALEGTDVGVNPRGDAYAAKTNIFNTAVLSNISAFRTTQVILDPIEPPDDLYFSENQYHFTSGYKQGAVISPGAEFRLMLTGRLFLEKDEPLVYGFGEIRPEDYEDEDDFEFFFTDDTGRLYAYDLTAGEYIMYIYLRDRIEALTIIIPEDIRGTATLGDIYLDEEPPPEEIERTHTLLTGRLLNPDGSPADAVSGELIKEDEIHSFTSRNDGRFHIDEVDPGTHRLYIEPTGEFIEIFIPDDIPEISTLGDIFIFSDALEFDDESEFIESAP